MGDVDDPRPRAIAGHGAALLPVAAIYGANASGKSNLLDAIDWLQEAVLDSHRAWAPENLERGYLQGRYGGVPFLGDLAGAAG